MAKRMREKAQAREVKRNARPVAPPRRNPRLQMQKPVDLWQGYRAIQAENKRLTEQVKLLRQEIKDLGGGKPQRHGLFEAMGLVRA